MTNWQWLQLLAAVGVYLAIGVIVGVWIDRGTKRQEPAWLGMLVIFWPTVLVVLLIAVLGYALRAATDWLWPPKVFPPDEDLLAWPGGSRRPRVTETRRRPGPPPCPPRRAGGR